MDSFYSVTVSGVYMWTQKILEKWVFIWSKILRKEMSKWVPSYCQNDCHKWVSLWTHTSNQTLNGLQWVELFYCLEMDSFPQNMILKSLFFLGLTHTPWNFWKMDIEVKIFRKEMSIIFCWNDCYKWESRQLFTPNQTNFEYLTLY